MSRRTLCAALLVVAACGRVSFEQTANGLDAGMAPPPDAPSGSDSMTAPLDAGPGAADAALMRLEGGTVLVDAGSADVDAGAVGGDGGSAAIEGGTAIVDAGGTAIVDAGGTAVVDAGPAVGDAGIAHGCDAGAGMCDLTSYCRGRIAWTDNAYLPYAECIYQLDAARAACNADPLCTICGYTIVPTGVGGTQACNDGGGMTGLRQWNCWPVTAIPTGQIPI